jgi:pyruvate formate lyase activating enzyme
VGNLDNVERVEVLPFHKMGEYKWQQLSLPYVLGDTQPPTLERVEHVIQIFRDHGLTAV